MKFKNVLNEAINEKDEGSQNQKYIDWFDKNVIKEVLKYTSNKVKMVVTFRSPGDVRIVGKDVWLYGEFKYTDEDGLLLSDPQMIKALHFCQKKGIRILLRNQSWRFVFPVNMVS